MVSSGGPHSSGLCFLHARQHWLLGRRPIAVGEILVGLLASVPMTSIVVQRRLRTRREDLSHRII